jgi:chemotaxis protein MotB
MSDSPEGSGFTPTRVKTKKDEGVWIFSFADLTLILMSFFAMMLAMSKPNKQQFDNVVSTIQDNKPGQPPSGLMVVADDLEKVIKKQHLEDDASVRIDVDGFILEFSDRLLFASGSVKASSQFVGTTDKVLRVLSQAPDHYKISIEGHTDDVPLKNVPGFKTNWDLSAARSITLLNLLNERGIDAQRMRVMAYADTQPKVLVKGKTGKELEDARRANRRVVIRLE